MGKVAGKSIALKLGATPTEKAVMDVKMNEKTDEIDVTDTMSAGDSKEFMTGLVDRSLSFASWYLDTEADPLEVGDSSAFVLEIGAKKFTGNLVVTGRDVEAGLSDAVKYSYTARITGAVTFTTVA
jgi:predicted secreted protein